MAENKKSIEANKRKIRYEIKMQKINNFRNFRRNKNKVGEKGNAKQN